LLPNRKRESTFFEYVVSHRFPYLRLTHQPNPQFSYRFLFNLFHPLPRDTHVVGYDSLGVRWILCRGEDSKPKVRIPITSAPTSHWSTLSDNMIVTAIRTPTTSKSQTMFIESRLDQFRFG